MDPHPALHRATLLDRHIASACADLRGAERRLALLLAEMTELGAHRLLGFASVAEYAHARHQLEPRKVRALVQIGRALPHHPALDRALEEGRLPWTKARELLRVIDEDNVDGWIDAAASMSSRDLELHIRAAVLGDHPHDVDPAKAPERVRLVFECDAVEAELIRDALAALRAQAGAGEELEDGAILAAMARRAAHELDPEAAPTAERYRVILEVCPCCGRTAGIESEVRDTLAAEAACDCEVVDMRPGPEQGALSRTIPPRVRRRVLHRDRYRCVVPGCRCRLWLDVHHLVFRSRGGDHSDDNLVTICPLHHRLIHDGLLAVERDPEGRIEVRRPESGVAHVGHRVLPPPPPAFAGKGSGREAPGARS